MKKKLLSIYLLIITLMLVTFTVGCSVEVTPTHTVTYVYDNGTQNKTVSVEDGKTIVAPTTPTKEGYTFDGWYIDDFKWGFYYMPVISDITLTAKWTANLLTVTFNYDDGTTESTTENVYAGNKIEYPQIPVRSGYAFDGWYSGETLWNFDNAITTNVELTAHWSRELEGFTVTFNPKNGEENSVVKVQDGETVTEPKTPIRKDCEFNGWYNGENKWNFATDKVTSSIILTAKWTVPDDYIFKIKYELYGGANNNPVIYLRSQGEVTLTDAEKDGYNFEGWFTDTTYTNKVSKITPDIEDDLTLYACFSKGFTKDGVNYLEYGIETIAKGISVGQEMLICELIDGCTAIGDNAFERFSGRLILPDTVTSIGKYAFKDCTLIAITGGKNVTKIGEGAFYNCDIRSFNNDETYDIVWPQGATKIEKDTFTNCWLHRVYLPKTVTTIDDTAFANVRHIDLLVNRTEYNLDNTEIIELYISKDETLENGVIYKINGDSKIATYCQNTDTSELRFADDCTQIADYAFQSLSNLTTVYFGSELKIIGYNAFANCTKLKTVFNYSDKQIIAGSTDYAFTENLENAYHCYNTVSNGVKYFCYGNEKIAMGFSGESIANLVIDDDCTQIAEYAFGENSVITSLTLGKNVKVVNTTAFCYCENLTAINFNNKLESIGRNAFISTGVKSLVFPSSLRTIGVQAFHGCDNLKSIQLNEGLTTIEQCAFQSSGLLSVTLPNSLTVMGNMAFRYCPITSLTLGTGLTKISQEAFLQTNITELILYDNITQIELGAFARCKNLKTVYLPKNLTSIADKAFFESDNLATVNNYSQLVIEKGSTDNGYVGCYAETINDFSQDE